MVAWGTLIAGLLIHGALTLWLFRRLWFLVAGKRLSRFVALAAYWVALAVCLPAVWWFCCAIANYLYSNVPSLWVAAWDIGLVWVFSIGFILSSALAVVMAITFSVKVFRYAKQPQLA